MTWSGDYPSIMNTKSRSLYLMAKSMEYDPNNANYWLQGILIPFI